MSLRMVKREYGGVLMRKSIKVTEELYDWLLDHARNKETFDQELKRLLEWDLK